MILSYDSIAVRLGNKQILESVSLSSRPGQLVGIVGANGCGKSTLIKTTFGTVRHQAGAITLDSQPISRFSPRELASCLGYVGQDANCPFNFSVRDVVSMGLYARKEPKNGKQIVADAMEELGVSALDIRHQLFVMDYLKQSRKDTLLVIHDLRLAAHYCDYLYMICDGRVYAQGTPEQVLCLENVRHVFGVEGHAGDTPSGAGDFILFP